MEKDAYTHGRWVQSTVNGREAEIWPEATFRESEQLVHVVQGGSDDNAIARACGDSILNRFPVKRSWREAAANARRIVACVNACEGIATAYLEKAYESRAEKTAETPKYPDEKEKIL